MKKYMSLIRLMLLVVSLIYGVESYANGDPVARFSSVNRVANPEPLSISEIYIIHEQINITHIDGYNCFDITYTLKNKSDKDFPEIHYGFPIDYTVADESEAYRFTVDYYSESIGETGWNERLIKDIEFTFNDRILPFHSSKESVREAGFVVETYGEYSDSIPVDAVNRRWFYTSFAMKPHADAKLNVRYKVYAGSYAGLFADYYDFSYYVRKTDNDNAIFNNVPFACRYFTDKFDILYDFTPAKHFGNGAPYVIDVNIDLSNLDNPWIRTDYGLYYYVNRIERNIYVSAEDLKPIDYTVHFTSDRSEKNLARIIDRLKIPESEFDISMAGDTVSIEFHRPRFVSDLACDIDTAGIRSINSIIEYADGSTKRYKYETADISGDSKNDNRIKSPVLLTVTDMYHDGITWSEYSVEIIPQTGGFDKDRFRVRSIRLVFDTDPAAVPDPLCKGVKVLDARF